MKTIANSLPNGDQVLMELLGFMSSAHELADAVAPYSVSGNGRPLPRFIGETAVAMKKSLIKDFASYFPALQNLIENGDGGTQAMNRLHDACFMFNAAQQRIHKVACVIRDDASREEVWELLKTVVGDLAVFICIQFGLYNLGSGEVQMAIAKHCERVGMTPDVLFGTLKQEMDEVERYWWAYEVMSPVYNALNDADPVFLNECEENNYPLTDAMALRIIEGTLDVAEARGMLTEHMLANTERDVDVTPSTLVSQMHLE